MKKGDRIECPHCGNDAFAVKKTLMDGWTNLGEVLACSACGEKVGDIGEEAESPKKNIAKSALADFLGVEEEEKKVLSATENEKHFCRDCIHYLKHPFLTRCSLHDKDVNPMDDCSDFKRNS